ncbi:endonuclease subunit [Vibrio phage vB_VmeM-32]|nr:endonuclease subunit [Vibrio phage vB_VmeM-32]
MFDIQIQMIRYKNICSVGSEFIEIPLDQHNKTLVTGKNGAGKSTMIEALCFLLYGKAFRNINKDGLINSHNKKQLVVEGKIRIKGHDYFIQRGIKPNLFKIYKNDELITECASATEYQKLFESEILGLSIQAFKQIIVLGKAGFVPFMELTTTKRREIVEELLDIAVIGDMNKLNKQQIGELKTKKETLDRAFESTSLLLDTKKEHLDQQKREHEQRILDNANTCKSFVSKVQELKSKLSQLDVERESLYVDKEKLSNGYFELRKKDVESEIQQTKEQLQKEIEILESSIPSEQELLIKINDSLNTLDNKLTEIQSTPEPIVISDTESVNISSQLVQLEQSILEMEQKRVPVLTFNIEGYNAEMNVIKTIQNEIRDKLVELNLNKTSIQKKIDMFSNGGVCPCCERELNDSHIDGGIDSLQQDILNIENIERELKEKHAQLEIELNQKTEVYKSAVSEFEAEKLEHASTLKELRNKHSSLTNELHDVKLNIEQSKREHEKYLAWVESESFRVNSEHDKNVSKYENEHKEKIKQIEFNLSEKRSILANIDQSLEFKLIQLDNERMKIETDIESRIEFNKQKTLETRNDIMYNSEKAREIKTLVDELKSKTFDETEIDELSEKLKSIKFEKMNISDELNCCLTTAELLKDTGVKSYIIKQYLPVFNKTINTYLGSMGADYHLVLNEQFEESILTKGRESQKYENLSQGEASRINFAMLLTWRDVASIISGVRINLLVLDEIFDGATDGDGVYAINKALSEMKSNVIVISHRVENSDESFDRHLQFEKKGRFTRLVN